MEEWKDIEGYEGCYQVSNEGNVKSLEKVILNPVTKRYNTKPSRILKPNKVAFGYLQVTLYNKVNGEKTRKSKYIHVLVAYAFIGEKRDGYEVNHIDEDKTNNKLSNLEYLTRKENNNYGTRVQRASKAMINGKKSKAIIGTNIQTGESIEFPSISEAK